MALLISLQEFSRSEINAKDSRVVQKLNEEKKRRETVLEMRHAMAKEVTQKSKESRGGRLGSCQRDWKCTTTCDCLTA